MFLDIRFIFIERELRGICSGKLLLDTEGVIIVQKMYNGRRQEYISLDKDSPEVNRRLTMKYTKEERLDIGAGFTTAS